MRSTFERELALLHESLIQMGTLIERTLADTIQALASPGGEVADRIRSYESQVDYMEKEIERRALTLLLSQQPVARDLRAVSTALKMITDMERIADQAVDISDIMVHLQGESAAANIHLTQMAEISSSMIKKSINSFVSQDLAMAQAVIDMDDQVDALFLQARNDMIALMRDNHDNAERAIDLLMIAKYFERIADHAVNIAEWVVFYLTGHHKNARIL